MAPTFDPFKILGIEANASDEEVKRAQVPACTWGGWRCRCLVRRSLTEASMRLKVGGVKQAVIAMRQQKEEEERRKLAEQQR